MENLIYIYIYIYIYHPFYIILFYIICVSNICQTKPGSQVGQAAGEHARALPACERYVEPDQGVEFQDLDGYESSDSGLESIL